MPRRNRGPHLVWLEARGAYYIAWSERGRSKRRSTGTGNRERAQAALAAFLRCQPGPRGPDQVLIADALADYGREHGPQTAAPDWIGYAIDALLPFWRGRVVAEITRATCQAYARARERKPATVRHELAVLRAAVNHAEREGRLTRAPAVFLPPKPQGRDRWLSRSEVAALLRAARRDPRCRLHLPLFVLTGLYTGARKQAILGLRWPQVDLERGRIDFNPPGRARTSKGRPIIPIPRRLVTFLRHARQRSGDLGCVVNHDGKRLGDIKKAFATACRHAGLNGVSPHTLRHTASTWMAQAGVPMWEIGGYLGHSTERTAELYAHHAPDHLARAREAFR